MAPKSVHSFALFACLLETRKKRIVQYNTIQYNIWIQMIDVLFPKK